ADNHNTKNNNNKTIYDCLSHHNMVEAWLEQLEVDPEAMENGPDQRWASISKGSDSESPDSTESMMSSNENQSSFQFHPVYHHHHYHHHHISPSKSNNR